MGDISSAVTGIAKALAESGPWGMVAIMFVAVVLIYKNNIKKEATILKMATEQLKVNMEMLPTLRDLAASARAGAEREQETTKVMVQLVDNLKEMRVKLDGVDKALTVHCAQEQRRP